MQRYALAIFLLCSPMLHAAQVETTWMKVMLDGRKIGHMKSQVEQREEKVFTTESMQIVMERDGTKLEVKSVDRSEETSEGMPIGFRSETWLAGASTIVIGEIAGEQLKVTTRSGSAKQVKTMAWPTGALLTHGMHLRGLQAGLVPGTEYQVLAFQASALQAANIRVRILPTLGKSKDWSHVHSVIEFPGMSLPVDSWVDQSHKIQFLSMPILGSNLDMLACDKACAMAPNQSSDILSQTLLASPMSLDAKKLKSGLQLELSVEGEQSLPLPSTAEQVVDKKSGVTLVRIVDSGLSASAALPAAEDTQATRWLQSDAPQIIKMAKAKAPKNLSASAAMLNLENAVRAHISKKNLRVGYASALDVLRSREGDCTEHAVLLAALGRARGIPTRVATGLAYVAQFNGKSDVFVPHAWVQAWTGDRWQSFDAALAGFDNAHITLDVGDGDPARFYAGLFLLGRLRIDAMEYLSNNAKQ